MLEQVADYTLVSVAGAGSLVAAALYLRKVFKGMGLEDSRRDAEFGVIHTLREEVARLAAINGEMSRALQDLQMEIIKLRNENITLMGEIAALKTENMQLTKEVLKLNDQLTKWDDHCENCIHKKGPK
jgi:FtsZ-binding cell division protein ZapB